MINKFSRILALVLALVMVLGMAACGTETTPDETQGNVPDETQGNVSGETQGNENV